MLGSVYRVGREAPAYQAARQAALLGFLRRYVGGRHQFLRNYMRDLEVADQWFKQQHEHHQRAGAELRESREWLEAQLRREQDAHANAVEQFRASISLLEQAKSYLEQERDNWQRAAEDAQKVLAEQTNWIRALEAGKDWLEQQRNRTAQELQDWQRRTQAAVESWKRQLPLRILRRARLLRDLKLDGTAEGDQPR
jgi:hypothetical protein